MAKHANLGQLFLLFILLISAVGCYCAFSKQLPDEAGLSKLKMNRNLKGTRLILNEDEINDDSDNDNYTTEQFNNIFGGSIQELNRKMCQGTDCLNDETCTNAGKTPDDIDFKPICGTCDVIAKKCTFGEAKPEKEVMPEQESKKEDTETTEE